MKYSTKSIVCIGAKRRREDQHWALSISDEAPGIAKEHLARIFDAFRRGDAHGQPGVGLGLAIASPATKLLGAELTVESSVGVGSRFRLICLQTSPPRDQGGPLRRVPAALAAGGLAGVGDAGGPRFGHALTLQRPVFVFVLD